jgi:hypothetical protein
MGCNCKHHLDTCPACETSELEQIRTELTESHRCHHESIDRAEKAEATILVVANNIAGSPATIIEWSVKVGEALTELGRLQQLDLEASLDLTRCSIRQVISDLTDEPMTHWAEDTVEHLEWVLRKTKEVRFAKTTPTC